MERFNSYSIHQHVPRFLDREVTGFTAPRAPVARSTFGRLVDRLGLRRTSSDEPGDTVLSDLDHRVYRIGVPYEDDWARFHELLAALLADPQVGSLKGLVIGHWPGAAAVEGPRPIIDALVAGREKMANLEGLFIGDLTSEESEISWLKQADHGPLLCALPRLRELVVRGSEDLRFSAPIHHPALTRLTLQSGGLRADCVRDLLAADLPELRQLVLWLGTAQYGGDVTLGDLQPLLDGTVFPRLEHLALANSDLADLLAVGLTEARILDRLQSLDLSMGTLTDVGGLALAQNPRILSLIHI